MKDMMGWSIPTSTYRRLGDRSRRAASGMALFMMCWVQQPATIAEHQCSQ